MVMLAESETFWSLLHDPAHWTFEVFLMVVFDGLIGALLWPHIKRWLKQHHHQEEAEHGEQQRAIEDLRERIERMEARRPSGGEREP
jgi:hypothetical protein